MLGCDDALDCRNAGGISAIGGIAAGALSRSFRTLCGSGWALSEDWTYSGERRNGEYDQETGEHTRTWVKWVVVVGAVKTRAIGSLSA
jgi:hypothetical protein